jgi:hypothetical protein
VIPKAVHKHDECNHATAKQRFPVAGHALKFSHTGSVKPPRVFCREKHGQTSPAISPRVYPPLNSDHRGVDLISDVLPFGRLWYTKPDDAVSYAAFFSRSHHAVIRIYDDAGNLIETHERKRDFSEP